MKPLFYAFFIYLSICLNATFAQNCDLNNYGSVPVIDSNSLPYTSPSSTITVSATLTNISTLSNTTYTCGGNTFATASPAWWINTNTGLIELDFSSPIASFTVVVNGTNSGEVFTFTSSTGTVSLSNFCTAGFSNTGNSLSCSSATTTGTIITVTNSTPVTQYSITHNGVGAGSRVSLLDCFGDAPLPVVLLNFSGTLVEEQEQIRLDWTTISEEGIEAFEVERAQDNLHFASLGQEKSKGKGNLQTEDYFFVDENPLEGTQYYRLKIRDLEGGFEYSHIIELNFEGNNISLFPNPNSGIFTLRGGGMAHAQVEISNELGVVVHRVLLSHLTEIDISGQPSGVYNLKIIGNKGVRVLRMIKK